jgi:hypothetical protein
MRFLLLLAATSLLAQSPLSFGLKGGIVRNSRPGAEIFPLKGGPFVELKLPLLPRIETGVLFERYQSQPFDAGIYQAPVLLKKRFGGLGFHPFISGGATFRGIPRINRNHAGITFAGGLSFALLPLKIEPEVRYTRWLNPSLSPQPSQTELLIGFRF